MTGSAHPAIQRSTRLLKYATRLIAVMVGVLCTPLYSAAEYSVTFNGVPSQSATKMIREASYLLSLRSSPPATMSALHRRAAEDIPQLVQILRSLGYYDAIVTYDIEEKRRISLVRVNVSAGPLYHLGEISILTAAVHPNVEELVMSSPVSPDPFLNLGSISSSDLGIKKGDPAIGKPVKEARKLLVERLAEMGYPLAEVVDQAYVADQSLKTLSVTWWVNSGPRVTFGESIISGLEKVRKRFVNKKIAWKKGAPYDPDLVDQTQKNLEKSRLFSSVEITHTERPTAGDQLPMLINLSERKHRSIGLGLSYNTDLGPGVSAEWEHRNMRGTGHRLSLKTELEDRDQLAQVTYRIPDFHRVDQDLIFTSRIRAQETENFKERTGSVATVIERKVNQKLKVSFGGEIKHIITKDSDNNRTRTLISSPLTARWSTADDPLNPTSGVMLNAFITPQSALPDANLNYVKLLLQASTYQKVFTDDFIVLAGKITTGSILGASQINIPPSERFYAGSESLLRGYQRLTVSPLDSRRKPVGGRSLLVSNLEMRLRTSEKVGWVGFFEAGNVYKSSYPEFSGQILMSAGIGFRYHTPIGPIRIDVAFPLDRRDGIDDKWELYLNIGQSF